MCFAFCTIIKIKQSILQSNREFDIQWTFYSELIFFWLKKIRSSNDHRTLWIRLYENIRVVYGWVCVFGAGSFFVTNFIVFLVFFVRSFVCFCRCCCCWFLFDCFVYGTFWSCAAILVVFLRLHSPHSIAVTLFFLLFHLRKCILNKINVT